MKWLAKSYNNLAAIYNHFGLYQDAINNMLKCLAITEKTNDSVSFAMRNLTASNTYFNLNQFDKAISYANKAIHNGKQFNNPFAVMMGMNNLSASYSALHELDSAIDISKQQLFLSKQQEDIVNVSYALINLCYDNFRKGNVNALANYARELENYKCNMSDSEAIANVYNSIVMHYIKQKNIISLRCNSTVVFM